MLVNNAGIGSAPSDGLAEFYTGPAAQAAGDTTAQADQTVHCTDEGWSRALSAALVGTFRCSRAAVRIMPEQGTGGAIVNIGSTAALAGHSPVPYFTAKAAVLGMTRAMARKLAPRGIHVNAVNPGATETPIFAPLPQEVKDAIGTDSLMKRLARPEEVTGAVASSACDDASFATGSTVIVNGGAWFS